MQTFNDLHSPYWEVGGLYTTFSSRRMTTKFIMTVVGARWPEGYHRRCPTARYKIPGSLSPSFCIYLHVNHRTQSHPPNAQQ